MANYIGNNVRVRIPNVNPPEQGCMWLIVIGSLGGSIWQIILGAAFVKGVSIETLPSRAVCGQLCQKYWEGLNGQLHQEHVQGQDYKCKPSRVGLYVAKCVRNTGRVYMANYIRKKVRVDFKFKPSRVGLYVASCVRNTGRVQSASGGVAAFHYFIDTSFAI